MERQKKHKANDLNSIICAMRLMQWIYLYDDDHCLFLFLLFLLSLVWLDEKQEKNFQFIA